MQNNENNPNDDYLITFQDLVRTLKKNKGVIKFGSCLIGGLALLFALMRQPQYLAEATFKEKGKTDSGMNKSLISQLVGGEATDSDALTMMKSRNLMERVIQKMGSQAIINKDELSFPFFPISHFKNNLLAEYAFFTRPKVPIVKDPTVELVTTDVAYNGEVPQEYTITVDDAETYTLRKNRRDVVGQGTFGEPFTGDHFTITLDTEKDIPHGTQYVMTLLPMGTYAKNLKNQFIVEADRDDKNLVKISFKHPNRHQAAETVTALMEAYQDHLTDEHSRLCCLQVDYLIQRQKEMAKQLSTVMDTHAASLSSDLSNTGFATSEKAMEFLAANQQSLKQKLLGIDIDIQRLKHMDATDDVDYERFTASNIPEPLHRLTAQMRSLKQESDGLNITLRNSPANAENFQESFKQQMDELDKVKSILEATKEMVADLNDNKLPKASNDLLNNPKFIVGMWYQRAKESYNEANNSQQQMREWEKNRDGFTAYLDHLIHYLYIYQRSIEERLSHQQSPLNEFQGINLATAKEMYINYSKELSDTEAQAIQKRFIANQITDPEFEISSLSTVLNDPISNEMISKASTITLALKDYENRSNREQERLKADLEIQKGFLKTHLEQSVQLLELREQFLKDKLLSLQNINLSLVQEQISLLEDQIRKFIGNAIENLYQEKKLILNNLKELRIEMASFPQKWAAEKLVEQQLNVNKTMVEEITKLVESKNISNNLEKIQSSPVDHPIVPLHPKAPHLLLLTLIGAFIGAFMSSAWVLAKSISRGVDASPENLQTAGLHVSGPISQQAAASLNDGSILDTDLSTLRRLAAYFIDCDHFLSNKLLIMKGGGPDYSSTLASLLNKIGYSAVVVDLSFDTPSPKGSTGMLQYLEGKADAPAIHHGRIESGGITRFDCEMILSPKCQNFLEDLCTKYKWVIVVTRASASDAEAAGLLELFRNVAITLTDETIDEIRPCLKIAKSHGHQVSFLFNDQGTL